MGKLAKYFKKTQTEYVCKDTLKVLGEEVAHELKTSLVALKSGIGGVKDCMDRLIQTYQLAKDSNLTVPDIFPQELQALTEALNHCEKETYYASNYINLFSANLIIEKVDQKNIGLLSIIECLKKAFYSFPQRTKLQKTALNVDFNFDDFMFNGQEKPMVLVFTNLIKTALKQIETSGNGHIKIATDIGLGYNRLLFSCYYKMTACQDIINIFDGLLQIKSSIELGLYFCKEIMKSLQGDITCHSEDNSQIEFILYFPKV